MPCWATQDRCVIVKSSDKTWSPVGENGKQLLKSTLDSKEIKPFSANRNQPWIFTGRTDAESEAPVTWPPDAKSWLIRKDPDSGKDWRKKEKRVAEDEMVRWTSLTQWTWISANWNGDGEGQRSLVFCSLWACRVRHGLATEQQQ